MLWRVSHAGSILAVAAASNRCHGGRSASQASAPRLRQFLRLLRATAHSSLVQLVLAVTKNLHPPPPEHGQEPLLTPSVTEPHPLSPRLGNASTLRDWVVPGIKVRCGNRTGSCSPEKVVLPSICKGKGSGMQPLGHHLHRGVTPVPVSSLEAARPCCPHR